MSAPEPDHHSPSWVERQIQRAIAEGRFDDIEGAGRPIPDLDQDYDPGWWAKRWLERDRAAEGLRELRRRLPGELARLAAAEPDERRRRLEEFNRRISRLNADADPDDRLPLLDLEH